ncbi:MAG: hypothetical protein HY908_04815 [Myxococcales bacterium]|nr:hypothetical protein [Myxococcales bacterium]
MVASAVLASAALASAALCLGGCRGERRPDAAPGPTALSSVAPARAEEPRPSAALTPGSTPDWSRQVGRCVRLEGYAGGAKIGPQLLAPGFAVGVVLDDPGGDEAWAKLPTSGRVRVEGIVTERADLPVFVPKPGEPIEQGIPVPAGTDLEAARRRYVVERARVELLRRVADVETELGAAVGRELALGGVLWSMNGHYWFVHDGVELHLEGAEPEGGWGAFHGRTLELRGRLARRPMPRLDQILLKARPDLADAFVLDVKSTAPHPPWPLEPCAAP